VATGLTATSAGLRIGRRVSRRCLELRPDRTLRRDVGMHAGSRICPIRLHRGVPARRQVRQRRLSRHVNRRAGHRVREFGWTCGCGPNGDGLGSGSSDGAWITGGADWATVGQWREWDRHDVASARSGPAFPFG
jgi:hypothetical protein